MAPWASTASTEYCLKHNVTYDHRVDDPANFNFCPVPGGGADALLFAAVAVALSCILYHRLSAVWVLLAGAGYQVAAYYINLGHFSNAATIWLGMTPSTVFFFIFLPPLLFVDAIHLDYFLFKKVMAHVLLFAFFNVVVSAAAMVPVLLWGLNLAADGWRPIDAALFAAMLAATDAVAVSSILHAGGAPEQLSLVLEGESLFNDASSIVLFEIFLKLASSSGPLPGGTTLLTHIAGEVAYLAGAGAVGGLIAGFVTRLVYKWLHYRHSPPAVEVALGVAMAYGTYLGTEYYLHGSGVIGVVVYGLYGAATTTYSLSSTARRGGAFQKFWEPLCFVANGAVFFFAGTSIVNFAIRIVPTLYPGRPWAALALTFTKLPAVLAASFGLRWGLLVLEAPLLSLVGPAMTWQECLFAAVGGLRGGLALILAQTVLSHHREVEDPQQQVVNAEMALWTAGFVLFTLTVNAPLLGPLMSALRLNTTSAAVKATHKQACATLLSHTRALLGALRSDEDEMWRGVDWAAVGRTACGLEQDVVELLVEGQGSGKGKRSSAPPAASSQQALSTTASTDALLELDEGDSASLYSDKDEEDGWAGYEEAMMGPNSTKRQQQGLKAAAGGAGAQEVGWDDVAGMGVGGDSPPAPPMLGGGIGEATTAAAAAAAARLSPSAAGNGGSPSPPPAQHPPHPYHHYHRSHHPLNPLVVVQMFQIGSPTSGIYRNRHQQQPGYTRNNSNPSTAAAAAAIRGDRSVTGLARGPLWRGRHQMAPSAPPPGLGEGSFRNIGWSPMAQAAAAAAAYGGGGEGGWGAPQQEQQLLQPGWAVPLLDDGAGSEAGVDDAEVLAEARAVLLAGLKRHFHYKGDEGLLSGRGLRVLVAACDAGLDVPGQPLGLWDVVHSYISQSWLTRQLCSLQLWLMRRQTALAAAATRAAKRSAAAAGGAGGGGGGGRGGRAAGKTKGKGRAKAGGGGGWQLAVLRFLSGLLRAHLGRVRAGSLEVALELWAALTTSQTAREAGRGAERDDTAAALAEELAGQAGLVWSFLEDREMEDPEEFSAIQTHRASLAVLRQQRAYMERLIAVGGVEEAVGGDLEEHLEARLRRMERAGPVLRSPGLTDLLQQQPWLVGAPPAILGWVKAAGELRPYAPGQCIIPPKRPGAPGVFLVLRGLCREERLVGGSSSSSSSSSNIHTTNSSGSSNTGQGGGAGSLRTTYVGVGGLLGFLDSCVGHAVPGLELVAAYAQGTALGGGPLVFVLPPRALTDIRRRAAGQGVTPEDAAAFSQLLVNMYRHAGSLLFDRFAEALTVLLTQYLRDAAQELVQLAQAGDPSKAPLRLHHQLESLLRPSPTHPHTGLDFPPLLYPPTAAAAAAAAAAGAGGNAAAGNSRSSSSGVWDLVQLLAGEAAAAKLLGDRAAVAVAAFKQSILTAEVIMVAPGDIIRQDTFMLLLDGTLVSPAPQLTAAVTKVDPGLTPAAVPAVQGGTSSSSSMAALGVPAPLVAVRGPAVLAWAPEAFLTLEHRFSTHAVTYRAGPSGALLLASTADINDSDAATPSGSAAGSSPRAAAGPGR